MLFFSRISEEKIINLEHVAMVESVNQKAKVYVHIVGVDKPIVLNAEETKQLLDDMDHAATLYRIEQNLHIKGIQEH